jgi:hypothetical protein
MNGVYQLEADFAVTGWTPIGEFPAKPFTGILHGNNHTITINSFSQEGLAKQAVGLFSYTAFAEMEDLAVHAELDTITVGASVEDQQVWFGFVIGNSLDAKLKNINVSGTINKAESTDTASALAVGGMVGILSSGKIEASQAVVEMIANSSGLLYIGGIIGYAYSAGEDITYSAGVVISDCSFEGSLEGSSGSYYSDAGGIVGCDALNKTTTIKRCQVKGNITAIGGTSRSSAGGIAGYGTGFGEQIFSIEDCSVGEGLVTASGSSNSNYAGGIIGQALSTDAVIRCTSAIDVTAFFDGTTNVNNFAVYAGGISGINQCSIQYCSASGDVLAHDAGTKTGYARNRALAGGISGQNTGSITQCYATGKVESLFSGDSALVASSAESIGAGGITGLTGEFQSNFAVGIVSDCYYGGDEIRAKGRYAQAGGIAGFVAGKTDEAKVSRSYSRGAIFAEGSAQFSETTTYQGSRVFNRDTAGGIAGSIPAYSTAGTPAIENCVALTSALTVVGPEDFYIKSGRIVGTNEGQGVSPYTTPAFLGTLQSNAADLTMTITRIITGGAATGPAKVDDAAETPEDTVDGLGVSIPLAQTVYTELGWDFAEVWKMGTAGYPVLAWQD